MITETYEARVTNNNDPDKRGKIKIACIGLLGDEETELPMWVEPVFDWGWFYVPDVGETVDVEAVVASEQDESFHQSSIDNLDLKWKGQRYYTSDSTEEETEVRLPHEDFTKENYGKRRGFATPNGHILYFDDTEGKQKVHLSWKQGDKYAYINIDSEGSILLANSKNSFIHLDAEMETISLVSQHGNSVELTENGISMIDKHGNVFEMKDGVVQVISQNGIVFTGKSANLKTGSVDLAEGADSPLVKGTEFKATHDIHTHFSAFGLTGPPSTPMPPSNLSTVVKTK